MLQPLWKTVWQFLEKLNIELSFDPAIPLLSVYLYKRIAALFIIAPKWKQLTCSPTDKLINKMWYIIWT